MRLFVAIEIPADIRAAIASLLKELRAISPQTKWVRRENMHLTLKFLGETDAAKLDEVQSTLASIRSTQPVTLEFRGLGFFPNAKRPRVFWAGIQSSPNLGKIVGEIDQAMHKIGFPQEDRAFAPHLTLTRLSEPSFPVDLQTAISKNDSRSFGDFSAREFHLIESNLKSAGAEYTTLRAFQFVSNDK